MSCRLLVVESNDRTRSALARFVRQGGSHVTEARNLVESIERLAGGDEIHAILCDIGSGGADLHYWIEYPPTLAQGAHLILTGTHSQADPFRDSIERGLCGFVENPFDAAALEKTLTRLAKVESEKAGPTDDSLDLVEWRRRYLPGLIGDDPGLVDAISQVRQIAGTDFSVMISGESGTGKELVARGIHAASTRCHSPMLSINCGAIHDGLVESELFGHVRGAFTGADRDRPGLFSAADGGTLFLDEVAELSQSTQAKLLRVLQEGEVVAVGAHQPTPVDVRIIAATHVCLETAVANGAFREDLYYRLNVIPIELPPLRDRIDDLELLLPLFIERFNGSLKSSVRGVDEQLVERLKAYAWPGNVREVENFVNRLLIMKRDGLLELSDLPARFGQSRLQSPSVASPARIGNAVGVDLREAVRSLERDLIDRAMDHANGNKSRAARLLNLSRTTLLARIRKLDEQPDEPLEPRRVLSVGRDRQRDPIRGGVAGSTAG